MTLDDIANQIYAKRNVFLAEMRDCYRPRRVVRARAEFASLAHRAGFSYPTIGRYLKKNHSTVLVGARKWERKWWAEQLRREKISV